MNKKDYGRPATDNNDFKQTPDYDSIRKNRNLDRDLDINKTSGRIREKDFDHTANAAIVTGKQIGRAHV